MLSVLIVGCGKIAGGSTETGSEAMFSHAGAYRHHGGFRLISCVDPDEEKLSRFKKKWDVEHQFTDLNGAISSGLNYDVVSICSPSAYHATDLRMALTARPKMVFCEKPLTMDLSKAEQIVQAYQEEKIRLGVNFTRRWDPEIRAFKKDLHADYWGAVRSGVGYYNKGIFNNGSHMIDLVQNLLGPLDLISSGPPHFDYFDDDPSVPALLTAHPDIPVHLVPGAANDYALFELHIVTEKGIVAIEESGFKWRERKVENEPRFADYFFLGEDQQRKGRYSDAMNLAGENVFESITDGASFACSGEMALGTQRLVHEIYERSNSHRK